MKRLLPSLLLFIALLSCSIETETHEEPIEVPEPVVSHEQKEEPETNPFEFTEETISTLYDSLDTRFDVEFELDDLQRLFRKVEPVELAQGNEFWYEFLIEDFECDCVDRLKIRYDDSSEMFELALYTELYIEDLDWCPEHTIGYGFKFKNGVISDTQVLFEAG